MVWNGFKGIFSSVKRKTCVILLESVHKCLLKLWFSDSSPSLTCCYFPPPSQILGFGHVCFKTKSLILSTGASHQFTHLCNRTESFMLVFRISALEQRAFKGWNWLLLAFLALTMFRRRYSAAPWRPRVGSAFKGRDPENRSCSGWVSECPSPLLRSVDMTTWNWSCYLSIFHYRSCKDYECKDSKLLGDINISWLVSKPKVYVSKLKKKNPIMTVRELTAALCPRPIVIF